MVSINALEIFTNKQLSYGDNNSIDLSINKDVNYCSATDNKYPFSCHGT